MMAQCEYLMGRLKDASVALPALRDREPERRVRGAGARPRREHRQAPEHVRGQQRPRRRDGAASRPRRDRATVVASGAGAQQLLDPARPLPRRRRQAELPGPDAHRRGRRRRDQAAVLQAGPDPGAAGDRDASRRAPRCTSTATAPATRTARTSRPATSRSSRRRPTTNRRRSELTLAPGERKLFTGDGRLRLTYVQRSGRPELLFASGLMGALLGAGAVAAAIGKDFEEPGRRVGRCWSPAAASRARSRAPSSARR